MDWNLREPRAAALVVAAITGLVGQLMVAVWPEPKAPLASLGVLLPSSHVLEGSSSAADGGGSGQVVAWPSVVSRSSADGRLRVDFAASSLNSPAAGSPALAATTAGLSGEGLRLEFAIESSGLAPKVVSVTPYLRDGRNFTIPAQLASAEALRVSLPGGVPRAYASIALSPCFDRRDLARLTLVVDPKSACRIDVQSFRIQRVAPEAGAGDPSAPEVAARAVPPSV